MQIMEPPRGFEPRTLGLRYRCSTTELRRLEMSFRCDVVKSYISPTEALAKVGAKAAYLSGFYKPKNRGKSEK